MLRLLPDMTYELTVDRTPVTLNGAVKLLPGGAAPLGTAPLGTAPVRAKRIAVARSRFPTVIT